MVNPSSKQTPSGCCCCCRGPTWPPTRVQERPRALDLQPVVRVAGSIHLPRHVRYIWRTCMRKPHPTGGRNHRGSAPDARHSLHPLCHRRPSSKVSDIPQLYLIGPLITSCSLCQVLRRQAWKCLCALLAVGNQRVEGAATRTLPGCGPLLVDGRGEHRTCCVLCVHEPRNGIEMAGAKSCLKCVSRG